MCVGGLYFWHVEKEKRTREREIKPALGCLDQRSMMVMEARTFVDGRSVM